MSFTWMASSIAYGGGPMRVTGRSKVKVRIISVSLAMTETTCAGPTGGAGGGAAPRVCSQRRDTTSGETERRNCEGLFLLIGADPRCEWLPPSVTLDDRGFVLTGRDVPQEAWTDGMPPASLATSAPGIFAVGDVRSGSMKRVAAASGEGSSVVPLVHSFLGTG